MTVLHEEKQPMIPLVGRVVIAIMSFGVILLSYHELMKSDKDIFWILLLILVVVFFSNYVVWKLVLQLRITNYEVRYKYPPFINNWKVIPKEHISGYAIEPYKWFKFGGWGYRYNLVQGGWAYTVFNKDVLVISRNTKDDVRIGTFKTSAVESAMAKLMEKRNG